MKDISCSSKTSRSTTGFGSIIVYIVHKSLFIKHFIEWSTWQTEQKESA